MTALILAYSKTISQLPHTNNICTLHIICVQVQERTKFNWTIKISDVKLKLKIKTRIRIGQCLPLLPADGEKTGFEWKIHTSRLWQMFPDSRWAKINIIPLSQSTDA